MFRIKKILAVLLAGSLMTGAGLVNADSELIPDADIDAESANYRTAELENGDVSVVTERGNVHFIYLHNTQYYDGEAVEFVEADVHSGDTVKAGDAVMTVRSILNAADVEEAKRTVERLKSAYELGLQEKDLKIEEMNTALAKETNERSRQRMAVNLRILDVERQRYVYEKEREIRQAEENYQEILEDSETGHIYAAKDGYLTKVKSYQAGDIIYPGAEILESTGDSTGLFSVENASFHYGMTVTVSFEIGSKEYEMEAKVVASEESLPDSSLEGVILELNEAIPDSMDMGMLMQAQKTLKVKACTAEMKNVPVLPVQAVQTDTSGSYVQILDEDNVLHKRYIIEGLRDEYNVWVLDGMEYGERAVLN